MATSNILEFAGSAAPGDIYTDAEYVADPDQAAGVQPGLAKPKLHNKTLKQVSLIAAAVAKFIADNQAVNITDALSVANIASYLTTAIAGLAAVPTGTIINFSGTSAPAGFVVCPISLTNVSRTTYAALFAAIGTTWGAGDGSTTFALPWFPADYAEVQANGNVGTATVGENLAHNHNYNAIGGGPGTINNGASGGVVSSGTSSSGGAANLAAGHRVLRCVKI